MSTPEFATTPAKRNRQRSLYLVIAGVIILVTIIAVWIIANGRLPFMPPRLNGIAIQSPEPAQNFTLTSQTGQPLSLTDLRGKVVLLYFGYTYCPDACPTTLAELKKATQTLGGDAEDVQVVMVSIDPERDTPEVLKTYMAYFDPSYIGLTGTEDEILAAATPYGVYFQKHEGSPATGYLVDHTTTVMAIDKEGYLRLFYPYGTAGEDIAADLRYLVND
jgi:protein SCO1/2